MSRTATLIAVIAITLVVAVTVARPTPGALPRPDPADLAPLGEQLAQLRIAPEANSDSYDREAFGSWATGPDGCSTRERVLIEESRTAPQVTDGCQVVAGDWTSLYDRYQTPNPAELEIDHLVALAEAWESGASTWTAQRRHDFANDLVHTDALIAVTAAINQAKSDRDPAQWMPPNQDSWCRYSEAWITQKLTWNLSVDGAEHQALIAIAAAGCTLGTRP